MNKSHWIVVGIICINITLLFSQYKTEYTQTIDLSALENQYQQSQYVNPESSTWIQDPPLYTYAGIQYMAGSDPASINFETQPLTKYLFGLTTLIFSNPLLLQLILYVTLIILTFFLGIRMGLNERWAILPTLLISLDPLIRQHAHTAYLDLMVTNVITLFLLVVASANPIFLGMIIGIIALSKSFMIGSIVFASYILAKLIAKSKIRPIVITALIALATYTVGYGFYFYHHHNLVDFFNLHIDILKLYKGYVPEYPKGEIFRIILTGQWRKWYGDFGLATVSEWWVFWPIGIIGSIYTISKTKLSSIKLSQLFPAVFFILYLTTISLKLVFPRYIMPLLPLMYVYTVKAILAKSSKKR